MESPPDWLEIKALLCEYRRIITRLQDLGVTRTNDAPTGGYAEFLVAASLNGRVADSTNEEAWDVELKSDGTRIQVKSYVGKPGAGISPVKSLEHPIVLIEFDETYSVARASHVNCEALARLCAGRAPSKRGYRPTPGQLHAVGVEIADRLQQAE